MLPTTIYDPAVTPDPVFAGGFLTYGQLPVAPIFVDKFPPANIAEIKDVYEVAPLTRSTSSTGVSLNTNGDLFVISPGYEPLNYYLSNGVTKNPTGRTFAKAPNRGYAGFANHTINLDLANINPFNFNLNSASLIPVNAGFPVLDPGAGFSIEFDLAIAYEQSNPNRAGFSLTLISNDLGKGAEFGFKEAGSNSDYIFIQNANLNAATEGERSTNPLEISNANRYRITFQDNDYTLAVNNVTLLSGQLRDYTFDPTASNPPFPSAINPYETQNFLFFGDNTDQGYSNFTLGQITINPIAPSFPDFTGDGKADILWRNQAGGQLGLWTMNRTNYGEASLFGPAVEAAWQVKAVGDLNGDNNPDLVWQHQTSNEVALWLMNGSTLASGAVLPEVISDWQVVETGDFNQDGNDDLLWRHNTAGQLAVWYMNGLSRIGGDLLVAPEVADPNWTVGAVGDFTKDGNMEIFWRNQLTGNNGFWKMNGITYVGTETVTDVGAEWSVNGAADFNRDGNLDLLWRQNIVGDNVLWLMNGLTLSEGVILPNIPVEQGWTSIV